MTDGEVVRLVLVVVGRRVENAMQWEEEITTTGVRRRMNAGVDLRDWEPEMVRHGQAALAAFAAQCEAGRQ